MTYEANKAWRHKHPKKWQKGKARYYQQFEKGAVSGGRSWAPEELDAVIRHTVPDRELAKKLGRSVRAIHVQRAKAAKTARLDKQEKAG